MTKRDAKDEKKAPKLRFKGFTDDWEQHKLSDYLSIPQKEVISNAKDLKLMTLKLNLGGITLTANRETLKLGATIYYKRHEGQLLYGKQNFFHGSMALIPKEAEGYATSGDVPALNISRINKNYLIDYIGRPDYYKPKEALSTGTGSKRIHEKTLLSFDIQVPSLEEQTKINQLFQSLDHTITLHEEKQKQLEQLKKGLSQKLFADKIGFPEIRFKGFGVPWEQCKFGNLFKFLQNNTLSRASLNNENGYGQNVHYGDVLIKYHEILDTSKIRLDYIPSKDTVDKYKKSFLENGDIIIADTAEDETVGKCTEILGLTKQKVISGLHTIPVRPKRKFAPGYLGFYLNSNAYHNQLRPLMQGIKVTSISKSSIKNTKVMYPVDLDEQDKISKMLINMDSLISANQQKIDQLKSLKQALLQQMFI